mmetsp:Transcript_135081/g.431204  ORF Transcript_135081/g.431204 Transcript_135081/m.431204 type:complete len:140 (-) Transcript_135081:1602-2021(-)
MCLDAGPALEHMRSGILDAVTCVSDVDCRFRSATLGISKIAESMRLRTILLKPCDGSAGQQFSIPRAFTEGRISLADDESVVFFMDGVGVLTVNRIAKDETGSMYVSLIVHGRPRDMSTFLADWRSDFDLPFADLSRDV